MLHTLFGMILDTTLKNQNIMIITKELVKVFRPYEVETGHAEKANRMVQLFNGHIVAENLRNQAS